MDWPNQTPAALNAFYGNPDKNNDGAPDLEWQRENLVAIPVPYAMFYDGKKVTKISVHKKCADALSRALIAVSKITTAEERKQYQLDRFGGVFNFRRKRGGTSLSTHSWAIAIDLAPALNGFGVKYGSRPNMMPMKVVEAFEAEGATWGGLWSNPDAMHFQFADIPGGKKPAVKPVAKPVEAPPKPEAITDEATVAKVQQQLWDLGYTEVGSKRPDGTFDGKIGRYTRAAILAFRDDNDLPTVNYIDEAMLLALLRAQPREVSTARTEAPAAVVREKVPEVQSNWLSKVGGAAGAAVSGVGLGVTGVLDNLDGARGFLEPLKGFVGDVPPWVWFLLLGAAALALFFNARRGEQQGIQAFQSGERR